MTDDRTLGKSATRCGTLLVWSSSHKQAKRTRKSRIFAISLKVLHTEASVSELTLSRQKILIGET